MITKSYFGPRNLSSALMILITVSVSGQIVDDGAIRTITNETISFTGNVLIGTNGSFTLLVLSDNAVLTNSADGVIGANVTATSNEVHLVSASARWQIGSTLFVGSNGIASQLVVSNGATVTNPGAIIGMESTASNNTVIVTGTNSVWTIGLLFPLRVGNGGSFNQMTVSNSGTVLSSGADIGFSPGANYNTALLTGSNTLWNIPPGTAVRVGRSGSFNGLVVRDGATLINSIGSIGTTLGANNNTAVVTGAGSLWTNRSDIRVGDAGTDNQLLISNGAAVFTATGDIGYGVTGNSNSVIVTGANSFWKSAAGTALRVGREGRFNQLVISNGATVFNSLGNIGATTTASNNLVMVTGAGSVWENHFELRVGDSGAANRLVISDAGTVIVSNAVFIGLNPASMNNHLILNGGSLIVSSSAGAGLLDVRRGTNQFNLGLIAADQLLMTNDAGIFEFNGGTLSVGTSTVSNGQPFLVGDSIHPANFFLAGNGLHNFAGTPGVSVSSNAMVTGNGILNGNFFLLAGGALSPGTSIGTILLSNSPSLQGTVMMELSNTGSLLTNDLIQVAGLLTYGGTLIVSNFGPTSLVAGDTFKLFHAETYAGSFSVLSLPPLDPGLDWSNKLLVDGSIEVVAAPQPKFSSLTISGTNVIISGTNGTAGANYVVLTATNLTIPSSNWVSIFTNQFAAGGSFLFSNAIAPGELQRYFRIRTP